MPAPGRSRSPSRGAGRTASASPAAPLPLKPREHEADVGHEVAVEGGQLVREAPVGVPPGTIVEVERLFFNVPARRKFLRAHVTEASHIAASVASLAAAYPDGGFQTEHGKRSLLEAPSVG